MLVILIQKQRSRRAFNKSRMICGRKVDYTTNVKEYGDKFELQKKHDFIFHGREIVKLLQFRKNNGLGEWVYHSVSSNGAEYSFFVPTDAGAFCFLFFDNVGPKSSNAGLVGN